LSMKSPSRPPKKVRPAEQKTSSIKDLIGKFNTSR
jgi:hypothetical protein